MLLILISLIPLLALWRFHKTELDRDFTPYAYPAVFNVGYLKDGHHDIKPPLIHWSFKLWHGCVSWLKLNQLAELRLLPAICSTVSLIALGNAGIGNFQVLALALLLSSPTLWAYMANTEWLTVLIMSVTLTFTSMPGWEPLAWMTLGLLPFANQKNVLLLVPVMWALGLSPTLTNLAALCTPGILILAYLTLTGRLKSFVNHCWTMPSKMGKSRTLKQNTLGHLHLLKPGLVLMVPFIAVANLNSPWLAVFGAVVVISLWSKQIVPHHFLLWAFPLALASEPTVLTFFAFAVVWSLRDLAIWLRPENIYKITFGGAGGDYGQRLEAGQWVADALKTQGVTEVWINSMDNNIYLQSGIKAWNMIVPEWMDSFEGLPPKVIIHGAGGINYDYDGNGYEVTGSSPNGVYVILERS